MSDYVTHRQNAREHLEAVAKRSKGRLVDSQHIEMAQVEALLALAAAIDRRQEDTTSNGSEGSDIHG
ncbi:hypothetical protein [Streptomyces sp. NPDC002599]|uniref:hypothetical protein n=1 Tax=Streptomyces sp. NPDC002599 TaxID=3154421 RepID=UPI00331F92D3